MTTGRINQVLNVYYLFK